MELHPFQIPLPMTKAHDFPGIAPGCHFKTGGQRCGFNNQRVIPGDGKRIIQAGKHAFAGVGNDGGLAVHHLRGAYHACARSLGNGLVTQTDAEYRQLSGIAADNLQRDTGFIGRTGAGRDNNFLRPERVDIHQGQLIIALYRNLRAQLAKILVQVPGERVIVVDKQYHSGSVTSRTASVYSLSRASLTTLLKMVCNGARSPIAPA